jgi:farnesyl-diphosphate farnesyltransferase
MNDRITDKDWEYCNNVLPKVSRTFALNIERLEGDIYKTVLIGYLIFRIADTFEDNTYRDEKEKIADLRDFSAIFKEDKGMIQRLKLYETLKFRWREKSHAKDLVENGHKVLKCYFDLPDVYRKIADPLITEASEGMAEFQQRKLRFRGEIFQLADINELVEYCYYVAGIVGIMLTEIFCQKGNIKEKRPELKAFQIHFGLALQLINIVKDYKKDIARGWCYIPSTITEKYGVELNNIEHLSVQQTRGVIDSLIPIIASYLDSCLRYIKLLPLSEKPIRMFCIIPFIIGYRTLVKIVKMEGNKVSREEVSSLLKASDRYALSNKDLEEDYLKVREDYFGSDYISLPPDQLRSADFPD